MINLAASLFIAYMVSSIWETFVHWKILHASKQAKLKWKRRGGIFSLLRKAHFSHSTIHHRKTYRTNYYCQFDTEQQKISLDSKLITRPYLRILGDRYGLSISGFWENVVFIAVPLLFSVSLFLLISPEYWFLGAFISIAPMLLSKYVHPLLHEKSPQSESTPFILRVFMRTKYYSFIKEYHFIHHKFVLCNFNLLLGGDYLFGVAKTLDDYPGFVVDDYGTNEGITNKIGSCERSEPRSEPIVGRARGSRGSD